MGHLQHLQHPRHLGQIAGSESRRRASVVLPTSATITSPPDDTDARRTFTVTWTVDQGSAQGDVYIDDVLAASGNGSAGVAANTGDRVIVVKVAGGAVSSPSITVHVKISILVIVDNSGAGVAGYLQFDTTPGGVTTGPLVGDTSLQIDGANLVSIDSNSGTQVNFTCAGFLGSGDTWVLQGQPTWLLDPVIYPDSGNVSYN